MAYLMVHHSIEDYSEWRPAYDGQESKRQAIGCRTDRIFRGISEPNEISVLLQCDSLEDAKKYVQSDDLHNGMKRRGIMGRPDVSYLEEAEGSSQQ
jgi:hypothetical protein